MKEKSQQQQAGADRLPKHIGYEGNAIRGGDAVEQNRQAKQDPGGEQHRRQNHAQHHRGRWRGRGGVGE